MCGRSGRSPDPAVRRVAISASRATARARRSSLCPARASADSTNRPSTANGVCCSRAPPLARSTTQAARVARSAAALMSAVRPEPHGPSMAIQRLGTGSEPVKRASNSSRNAPALEQAGAPVAPGTAVGRRRLGVGHGHGRLPGPSAPAVPAGRWRGRTRIGDLSRRERFAFEAALPLLDRLHNGNGRVRSWACSPEVAIQPLRAPTKHGMAQNAVKATPGGPGTTTRSTSRGRCPATVSVRSMSHGEVNVPGQDRWADDRFVLARGSGHQRTQGRPGLAGRGHRLARACTPHDPGGRGRRHPGRRGVVGAGARGWRGRASRRAPSARTRWWR